MLQKEPAVRRVLDRLVEKLPAVHQRIFMYELARFYRSLGILLQGGIPLVTAMGMVRGLLTVASRVRLDQACELSLIHIRAHETLRYLVCRLLLEKKKVKQKISKTRSCSSPSCKQATQRTSPRPSTH
ncbi:hypothetical protein PS880_06320 [Pseudomonas fluorescens]|uniref:Uncharacterized protein n=1 Tax=Pseudomonas fluorescens TaxID=294 RepID=A0A5E7QI55_PSEFL|nr:hypothetical protein PS880_06320 [Pseudomonas fluorescens]